MAILQGYYWFRQDGHPRSNRGYIKRSVLVLEEKLGRQLKPGEMVHHKDGNRLNDDPANIEVTTRSLHMSQHSPINDRWQKQRECLARRKQEAIELWQRGWNTSQIREYMHIGGHTLLKYLHEIRQDTRSRRERTVEIVYEEK